MLPSVEGTVGALEKRFCSHRKNEMNATFPVRTVVDHYVILSYVCYRYFEWNKLCCVRIRLL